MDIASPCPFCGWFPKSVDQWSDDQYSVSCDTCGAHGPIGVNPVSAVKLWELRPTDASQAISRLAS